MARFNLEIDYRTAVTSRIVQSFGLAFLFVPISAAAFACIPKERTSYATGLVQPGAQHRRQLRHRHRHHHCWRAARSFTSRCWWRT